MSEATMAQFIATALEAACEPSIRMVDWSDVGDVTVRIFDGNEFRTYRMTVRDITNED